MTSPSVPVSWGELLDKIAILRIKTRRLGAPVARADAAVELELLRRAAGVPAGVADLLAALDAVNLRLWRIEELIRTKDTAGDFGPGFVALARAVYQENDERGRIKQALNRRLGSTLVEQKQYSGYQRPTDQQPIGQRPTGQRSTGQRPMGQRPTGEVPTGEVPTGERPTGQRPTGQRPTGATPAEPKKNSA
ncbi:hypothetical protein [Rhodopila sp.]|uniref:hypothetical protein n=1 Tax=Rhodopila sp. TaxID=2480087 RepID=UPI003D0C81F3